MEFAREKSGLFDKWCHASTLEELRELVLLEEFKNCLPEKVVKVEQSKVTKHQQMKSGSVNPPQGAEQDETDDDFKPFVSRGFVSLMGKKTKVPIIILWDMGAKLSIIRRDVLPFSDQSYCGSDILA